MVYFFLETHEEGDNICCINSSGRVHISSKTRSTTASSRGNGANKINIEKNIKEILRIYLLQCTRCSLPILHKLCIFRLKVCCCCRCTGG